MLTRDYIVIPAILIAAVAIVGYFYSPRLQLMVGRYLRVFLSVGVALIVTIFGLLLFPLATVVAMGAFTGFMVVLFAMTPVPGLIDTLTNRPNRYRPIDPQTGLPVATLSYPPSRFGFFTYIEPNRVKLKERGGRFIGAIMGTPGRKFKGERPDNDLTPGMEEYWEVVPSETFPDTHPIPVPGEKLGLFFWVWLLYSPVSLIWWVWKRWVYKTTGAVFTGFAPFQTVRTYPMERFKKITDPVKGEITLVRIEDFSDHYRVGDFQFPIRIPRADTKDKIAVSVLLNEIGQVVNPYQTAYNTDNDWPTRFLASISDVVTSFTRPRPLDEVLSAKDPTGVGEFAEWIKIEATKSLRFIGIIVRESQIPDISPSDPEMIPKLGDVAIARIDRDAMAIRAEGEALQIEKTGAAMKQHPQAALVLAIEGTVRAAEAAGKNGGIVMLGATSLDAGQAAIYNELRKQGGGRR